MRREERNPRRNRHKALHARILKDRERHDQPKAHRQTPDRLQLENAGLHADILVRALHVSLAGRVVRHLVFVAEVAVEEDERDGAEEGEEGDDGRDPERPGVGAEGGGDNVGGGLARELGEVGDGPECDSQYFGVLLFH